MWPKARATGCLRWCRGRRARRGLSCMNIPTGRSVKCSGAGDHDANDTRCTCWTGCARGTVLRANVVNRQEAAARTRESPAGRRRAAGKDHRTGRAERQPHRGRGRRLKGAFFHHFPDRASYLLVLHRDFHDRILAEARAVLGDAQPGPTGCCGRRGPTSTPACGEARVRSLPWRHGRSR